MWVLVEDPVLLQGWHSSQMWLRSSTATPVVWASTMAPIQPLAWELPCATRATIERKEKKKKKEKWLNLGKNSELFSILICLIPISLSSLRFVAAMKIKNLMTLALTSSLEPLEGEKQMRTSLKAPCPENCYYLI